MPNTTAAAATWFEPGALVVRVEGPDDRTIHAADARRLFPDGTSSEHDLRLGRLLACPRVVVTANGRVVALATCRQVDRELQVLDFAINLPSQRAARNDRVTMLRVFHAVLDVIELASAAGGCDRILVHPPHVPARTLERRGYVAVGEGGAGCGWRKSLAGLALSARRNFGGCQSRSG